MKGIQNQFDIQRYKQILIKGFVETGISFNSGDKVNVKHNHSYTVTFYVYK